MCTMLEILNQILITYFISLRYGVDFCVGGVDAILVHHVSCRDRLIEYIQNLFQNSHLQTLGAYFACYNPYDNGMSYIGPKAESRNGKKCLNQANGEISYCRNVDNSSSSPWCRTSSTTKEICDVDLCFGIIVCL